MKPSTAIPIAQALAQVTTPQEQRHNEIVNDFGEARLRAFHALVANAQVDTAGLKFRSWNASGACVLHIHGHGWSGITLRALSDLNRFWGQLGGDAVALGDARNCVPVYDMSEPLQRAFARIITGEVKST